MGDCSHRKRCSLRLKFPLVRYFLFLNSVFNVQCNDSIGYTFLSTSGFSSIYTHLMILWFKTLQLINSAKNAVQNVSAFSCIVNNYNNIVV